MKHESFETKRIDIEESTVGFKELENIFQLDSDTVKNILQSNFILLPEEYNGEFSFPEHTMQFYDYLKNKEKENNFIVEVASGDDEYDEIEMHGELLNLCEILIDSPLYDVAIGLITSYLYDLIKSRNKSLKGRVVINVEIKDKTKKVTYEGDIENFSDAMKSVKESLWKD